MERYLLLTIHKDGRVLVSTYFDYIKSKRWKWLLCILIGFLVSVGVESIRYVFALGRAETDDVICNTLGCALGVLAEVVAEGIKKR